MSGCSVVTISKINDGSVEKSKVYNGIMENQKVILYQSLLEVSKPEKIDMFYEYLSGFADDIVDKCYAKVNDLCIEIEIDEPMQELSFEVKMLMSTGEQMLDQTFFELCNDLNDKYEEKTIADDMLSLSFDFNIEMKNEYTRTISIQKRG